MVKDIVRDLIVNLFKDFVCELNKFDYICHILKINIYEKKNN